MSLSFNPPKNLSTRPLLSIWDGRISRIMKCSMVTKSGHNSVARRLIEYFKKPFDGGHIVFATHQVLPFIRFWANRSHWHVLIDEVPQIVKSGCFRIPYTHSLITDHLGLQLHDSIYSRLTVSDMAAMTNIAQNKGQDEILENFRETGQLLTNEHWKSFVDTEKYEKLKSGAVQTLSVHSILSPNVLRGFASVMIVGADVEDTLLYSIWQNSGVEFKKDDDFANSLRFRHHHNGHLITIKYLTDGHWSKYRQNETHVSKGHGTTLLNMMIDCVRHEFGDRPFLYQANKSLASKPFGDTATQLPNLPFGLNDYSHFNNIAFLSALNPRSDHYRFLAGRGVDDHSVRRAVYCSTVYQAVMRTSIRDPNNSEPKEVIVPDIITARYLQDRVVGAKLIKLETDLVEAPKQLGRPPKYNSSMSRQARYRLKCKQQSLNELLSLKDGPYFDAISCDGTKESKLGDKIAIDINTHFVSLHGLNGTLYRSIKSGLPSGYLYAPDIETFVEFLKHLHGRSFQTKDDNILISPAIFDPKKANRKTKRGLDNIVAMRHLWLDFENGDLSPNEFAQLFPQIRLLIFNTYNHTKEKPRFRVFIPLSKLLTAAEYEILWDAVAAKIEAAGYSVRQSGDGPRSGIDKGKRTPTSLFYLRCQAANDPTDSFFYDYNNSKRKILDPSPWIEHAIVPFRSQRKLGPPPRIPQAGNVNEAAIQAATDQWRESRNHPGTGNSSFWAYAVALRTAGMSLDQIGLKLEQEAKHGRSPDKRLAQIPSILASLESSCKKAG